MLCVVYVIGVFVVFGVVGVFFFVGVGGVVFWLVWSCGCLLGVDDEVVRLVWMV